MAVRITSANARYTANLNLGSTNTWTFTAWIRVNSARSLGTAVGFGSSSNYMVFQQGFEDSSGLVAWDGSSGERPINGVPATGNWFFFAVTKEGSNYTIRVRSATSNNFTTTTFSSSRPSSLQQLVLGCSFDTAEYFNGDLAVIKLWSGVALSQAEVEAEFPYDAPLRTQDLTAYYRFTGPSTVDDSGNGYTLTGGSGATQVADPPNLIPVPSGDTEPPTAPTNLAATGVTTNSVSLAWNASTDNEGVTGYEVYRDDSLVTTVTGTTYTDSTLNPSTTYTYKVRATDAAENFSDFSNEIQVTTLADVDEEAPTAPSNLTVTGHTWNSVSLAWDPSTDNVGVVGYEVYRDDALVETVGYTSYTDTGLMPETSYVYKVRAKDAAGNVSEFSDEATVATNPIPEPGDGGAAVDPSSPPMVAVRRTETISTEPFTAPADSLLVVMHGSDYYQAGAVLSNSGDPLDWDHVVSSTGSEYNGVADIWAAPVPQTRELTVTLTVPDDYPGHGLKVFVVTGADTSNPIGATAQGEAGGQSQYNLNLYTSTALNSLAMAVVSDFYREFDSLPSVGSGWIGVPWDSENQSGVAAYAASVTSTPGTPVQMTYTAANELASAIHWAAIEILPGESTEPPTPTLVIHGWGLVPIARIK